MIALVGSHAALVGYGALHLLTMNPLAGLEHMLSHPFMAHAYEAGTLVALSSGLAGWFLVMRAQVFSIDALSHVAAAGALAALVIGIDLRIGLFATCVVVGVAMAGLGRVGHADDTAIGSVFAWILGITALLLTLYTTRHSAENAVAGMNVLFGTIFGLSGSQTAVAAFGGLGVTLAVLAVARPLLFASLDGAVAQARGVPVRLLNVGFLALVGFTAAEGSQAVGALLVVGLVAAPSGAAQRLTTRPFAGMWLSGAIAVACMWVGLALSYAVVRIPPSFAIVATAGVVYFATFVTIRSPATDRALHTTTLRSSDV